MLLFVGTIQNSRRPPWPLIGRDILESFSRTFACQVNRLARNIPYGVVGLRNELKYQNSAPAYDWLRHDLLLRNNPSDLPEMFTGVFSKCYYLKIDFKSKLADLVI